MWRCRPFDTIDSTALLVCTRTYCSKIITEMNLTLDSSHVSFYAAHTGIMFNSDVLLIDQPSSTPPHGPHSGPMSMDVGRLRFPKCRILILMCSDMIQFLYTWAEHHRLYRRNNTAYLCRFFKRIQAQLLNSQVSPLYLTQPNHWLSITRLKFEATSSNHVSAACAALEHGYASPTSFTYNTRPLGLRYSCYIWSFPISKSQSLSSWSTSNTSIWQCFTNDQS